MRDRGLVLDIKENLILAISKLTEKSAIYQRKISTHEKRAEFSKTNRLYEVLRSQFYRNLGGVESTKIDIEEDLVK